MYIYGASGHAKVVFDVLVSNGIDIEGIIDDNADILSFNGFKVRHSYSGESPVLIAIGDNKSRELITKRLNCRYIIAIHPSAIISNHAKIGDGTVVMPGVVVNSNAVIGNHCIINTHATVEHDCIVCDFAHISPGAVMCGNVKVGRGSWIGAGTVVKQGISIGENVVVGAGSVVLHDLPDNVVAYGNPCKVKNNL